MERTIPEQVDYYCKLTGLCQSEVARRLGISPQRLYNYKKGNRQIRAVDFEKLKKLARCSKQTGRGRNDPARPVQIHPHGANPA